MANVGGINPTQGPPPVQPGPAAHSSAPDQASPLADTVEISQQAQLASKIASLDPVRADLVAQVRAEIQAGTYETAEKLDTAIARLLNEL